MEDTGLRAASRAELDEVVAAEDQVFRDLPERLMAELRGAAHRRTLHVSQLEHALQTATRAMRGGADDGYVVAALVHDIGDSLAPTNHGEIAAAILRPFVDERTRWTIELHPVFQAQFYYAQLGKVWEPPADIVEHPFAADAQEFVEKYDEPAFSPTYSTKPLEYFEPVLRRVLAEPLRATRGM